MARKSVSDSPDVVTCSGCGTQVDRAKAPKYNARHGSGVWCPVCNGPLTADSVDCMQIGLSKSDNAAVKTALREGIDA